MHPVTTYLENLKSAAAKTYDIQKSEVHVGHAILQAMAEHPDFIAQVEATTGETETFKSIRRNVIRLSVSVSRSGINSGDVVLMLVPNSFETCVIIYMSFVTGLPFLAIDVNSQRKEIEYRLTLVNPKIIFCVKDNEEVVKDIIKINNFIATIIVLDDPNANIETFIKNHNVNDDDVESFKPARVESCAPAWLQCTSGTTGIPKLAIISHRHLFFNQQFFLHYFVTFPMPTKSVILWSSPQSVFTMALYCRSALLVFTRVQTIHRVTLELLQDIFYKWKPTHMVSSTTFLIQMLENGCDLSCLDLIICGGSVLYEKYNRKFRESFPSVRFVYGYGLNETGTLFQKVSYEPLLSVGKEFSMGHKYCLVEPSTGDVIDKPNVRGELWIKNELPFDGYYNNHLETLNALSEDGYFKTGDLFYKDNDGYYFFVERMKTLLTYEGCHVYPSEVEAVLLGHSTVIDAAVIGVPDPLRGELPAAVVVLHKGAIVSASELRELVAKELGEKKQLRGGIVFVERLPLTASFKINRRELLDLFVTRKVEF